MNQNFNIQKIFFLPKKEIFFVFEDFILLRFHATKFGPFDPWIWDR